MTRSFFSRVDEHIGRNKTARAVAMAGLKRAMLDFQLTIYLLEDGTEQTGALLTAAQVIAVALRVRELQNNSDGAPVMRGAQSAILNMSRHGFMWRVSDAVAIDVGLTEANKAMNSAPARQAQDAWVFVRKLEEAA
jgi:hypothetical protein